MSQKLTLASGVKEEQGVGHDDTITRGASGGEGEKCKDKNDVRGGGHHNVQEDTGQDSGLVKEDDEVYQHYGDASNLKGATSSESQAPIESKSSNVVSTADLLAGLPLDGSAPLFLQQQEQAVGDEQVGDQQHVVLPEEVVLNLFYLKPGDVSQQFGDASTDGSNSLFLPYQEEAVWDETVGAELHPDSKSISARDLQQQLVVIGSQDLSVLLPKEIVLMLFKVMKPVDIVAASQTCRHWRILGENDQLWKHKCEEAGLTYNLNSADLKIVKRRTKETSIAYSPWKVNFLKPFKIERKFRQGVPQVLTIERSHYVNQLEVFNNKIVYSNDDGTLYVFSALSGVLLHELVGHTRGVSTFQMDEEFVVSGSHDGSVKVWDVATGSCLHTMRGHTGEVRCLKMHGTIAVSGSFDGTLRMWDVREGSCLRILSGHNGDVVHVQFDGRLVVSGSEDKTIKIWDSETGECRRTMNNDSHIHSLKFNGIDVVAGYYGGSIKVWDVTGVCRHTLVGGGSEWFMELQGNILVCRGADRTTAKIWNISTGACLHMLAGPQKHSDLITGIQLKRRFVVTSSGDGTVKLWDIKTGEFIRDLLVLESGECVTDMRMKDAKIVFEVANDISKILVFNFDTNDKDYEVSHEEVKT